MSYSQRISLFRQELLGELSSLYEREEANMILRYLLEHLTGKAWYQLSIDPSLSFSPNQYEHAIQSAQRLLQEEPVQYVIGEAHFYGREFAVTPSVLIPRPETEELVHWVMEERLNIQSSLPIRGIDIGTGTGCIPITLELEWKQQGITSQWIGWDVSEAAIAVAQQNTTLHKVATSFVQQDIFEARPETLSGQDLILSNPPYIPHKDRSLMRANVLDHEPDLALFVPDDDPLKFYRQIVTLAAIWLKSGGALFFEIHEAFGEEVAALFEETIWTKAEIRNDLRGKPRMVRAFRQ